MDELRGGSSSIAVMDAMDLLTAQLRAAALLAKENEFDQPSYDDLEQFYPLLVKLAAISPRLVDRSDIAIGPDGAIGVVITLPRAIVTLEKIRGKPLFDYVVRDTATDGTEVGERVSLPVLTQVIAAAAA